ncbi:hypothetical protein AB0M11_26355 [Streptomyces sp. NPDC051987]|uniref:hypothetical protein n=1 Tax=Streptomyces sp. NPDC051987 TaxID=3155808 RepID=UPI00342ED3A7
MPLAVGACCLMASLSGAALIARAWPKPSGAHRAPHPMLRPVEALDQFEAHCPHEGRTTLHARLRLGGVVCMDCRNPDGSA